MKSHDTDAEMFDFISAAKADDVERLSRILNNNNNNSNILIDRSDWVHNETALTIATKHGKKKSIEFLLASGADVNHVNRKGKRPLYYAVMENHCDCLQLILSYANTELNASVHEGLSPLMLSAKLGFHSNVKLLIDRGCNSDMKSRSENKGAVHYSVQPEPWQPTLIQSKKRNDDGRFLCLKALVESGADVNLADGDGMTPLHYAIRNRNVKAVELLVSEGCLVNVTARWETALSCCVGPVTPALLALYVADARITRVLLAAGCNFLTCPAMVKIKTSEPRLLCLGPCHSTPQNYDSDVPRVKRDPRNLLSLCRLAVRRIMGQNITRFADQLKLPAPLILFISKTQYEFELLSYLTNC